MEQNIDLKSMNKELMNLKKEVSVLKELMGEDLEFARRTEEAFERHESGDLIEMDGEEFREEMKKW